VAGSLAAYPPVVLMVALIADAEVAVYVNTVLAEWAVPRL
jgi:hypothetical protein